MHVTRSSSDVSRPTRSGRRQSTTVLIVTDGAPPHALVEHACGRLGRRVGGHTRFLRRNDWQPLVEDDAEPLPDDAVVVIATLYTCTKALPWRGRPRFQEVMRRTILVAPLRQDVGAAMVAACGLGGFVPLAKISTHLAPAVHTLAVQSLAARRSARCP